jgi:hypothetical protein
MESDFIKITENAISIEETSSLVGSPSAGATSIFVGKYSTAEFLVAHLLTPFSAPPPPRQGPHKYRLRGCSCGPGLVNQDDLFNKALITALINSQNDISTLNELSSDKVHSNDIVSGKSFSDTIPVYSSRLAMLARLM